MKIIPQIRKIGAICVCCGWISAGAFLGTSCTVTAGPPYVGAGVGPTFVGVGGPAYYPGYYRPGYRYWRGPYGGPAYRPYYRGGWRGGAAYGPHRGYYGPGRGNTAAWHGGRGGAGWHGGGGGRHR